MKELFRKFLFIQLLLVIGLLVSCSPDDPDELSNLPVACFSISENPQVGTAIHFNSGCSKNGLTYFWDFGDGNSSTEENPYHTYLSGGAYEVGLKILGTNEIADEVFKTIEIADAPEASIISHYVDINEDEVWEAGIHRIHGSITINDAILTIQPGAIIRITEDGALNVGTNRETTSATLIANGTPNQPIIFTADSDTPTKNYHKGIAFGLGDSGNSSLSYCILEYGGASYSTGEAVYINGAEINFEHNKVRHTSGYGVSLSEGSFKSFDYNEFSDCDEGPFAINANSVHKIGLNNTFNTDKPLVIQGSTLTERDVTWKKLSHPYSIKGEVWVGSAEGTTLTIEPGTILKFEGGAMTIGPTAGEKGKLLAEGTADNHILFTSSNENPAPGNWGGLYFGRGNDPASSVKYATLEYGGRDFSNRQAVIRVDWTSVNINNCLIQHSSPYAILLSEEGYFNSFEGNNINNEGHNGIIVHANWVHTIGTSNTFLANKEISVIGGSITQEHVTWTKRPFPYHTTGWLYVGSETGSTLTIEAGTTIIMELGKSFGIGGTQYTTSQGALIANGTAEEPIIFTSAGRSTGTAAGDWEGIYFYDGSMAGSLLNYCTIEFGGSIKSLGSVYVRGTDFPTVTNTTIKNSAGYGIVAENANPTFENNIFIDNAMDDYYTR